MAGRGCVCLLLPARRPHRRSTGSMRPSQKLSGPHTCSLTCDPFSCPPALYCPTSKCCFQCPCSPDSCLLVPSLSYGCSWTPSLSSAKSVLASSVPIHTVEAHLLFVRCSLRAGARRAEGGGCLQISCPGSPGLLLSPQPLGVSKPRNSLLSHPSPPLPITAHKCVMSSIDIVP